MVLEKYRNEIYWCCRCSYCRDTTSDALGFYKVCPVYERLRMEHYNARGRVAIALALVEGLINYTKPLAEVAYTCLGCGACREICVALTDLKRPGINTPAITRAMRQDIVRAGLGPLPALKEVDSNVQKTRNPFGGAVEKRPEWAAELALPKKGNVVYFAGCYVAYRYPETGKAMANILKEGGIDVAYLAEDEWCCGVPELWNGNIALAEEVIKHNVDAIKAAGAERVVTSCAGCYHALKTDYPEIVGKIPYEVVHSSEIIADLIEKGKIKLTEEIVKTLTYHDPCHLGRHEKVYDPPRKILGSVKGAKFVEMLRNKANAWCCGGGSVVYAAFPNLAAEIASDRISEAKNVNAETLVTACPLCITVLTPAARKAGIEVYDLPVVVAKAMGLEV